MSWTLRATTSLFWKVFQSTSPLDRSVSSNKGERWDPAVQWHFIQVFCLCVCFPFHPITRLSLTLLGSGEELNVSQGHYFPEKIILNPISFSSCAPGPVSPIYFIFVYPIVLIFSLPPSACWRAFLPTKALAVAVFSSHLTLHPSLPRHSGLLVTQGWCSQAGGMSLSV